MIEQNNTITLYPSNWLYNAGVVGLKYLDELEEINKINFDNGSVKLSKRYFDEIDVNRRFFSENKTLRVAIVGKSSLYPNYINSSRKQDRNNFPLYIKSLKRLQNGGHNCGICANKFNFTMARINALNKIWNNKENDFNIFNNGISKFSNKFNGDLGGASSLFPNGFWNMNNSVSICPLCNIILIHHHLALTKLSDYSEIFINAPSFKVMYELNKLVHKTYSSANMEELRNKRKILATSVIEYSRRIKNTLGIWSEMNLEIVTKKNDGIEFFSLSYNVIKVISDRSIASILSELGEYKILNVILDQKYSYLLDYSYKLIKLSTKEILNKSDREVLNSILYQPFNKAHLTQTANKILMLYSLIEEKTKRS